MTLLLLLLAFASPARAQDEDEPTDEELLEEAAGVGDSCTVTTKRGAMRLTADVEGETSKVTTGLFSSKAWLEGDEIRQRAGLFKPRIGAIEGDVVVFRQGLVRSRSEPVSGGVVLLKQGLTKHRFTGSGCDARQLALGAAHLYAVRRSLDQQASAATQ